MDDQQTAGQQMSPEDQIRMHLDAALRLLREQSKVVVNERGRATKVAITQLELASMAAVRSFFADEEYSPMKKLKAA